jgi:HD superfamily phosphohydrolase
MNEDQQLPLENAGVASNTPNADATDNVQIKQIGAGSGTTDLFEDRFEFIDDVHGQVNLNRLERDVVDSPEFQRLFRLSQLGFVDLVYTTANHTRAVHSIGACFLAKGLVDRLNKNTQARVGKGIVGFQNVPQISRAEKVLISLGGLLHDISHGPFSHDIEKKTHHVFLDEKKRDQAIKVKSHYGPYEKHDSYTENPSLYVVLMDTHVSLLARVLRRYSSDFLKLLNEDGNAYDHLRVFTERLGKVKWPQVADQILPTLLFHLLVYEKPDEAKQVPLHVRRSFDSGTPQPFGIGPDSSAWIELHNAWYQPFRHDVIGDTLSADLIDYLMRDQSRLGMKGALDDKLLNFYVLVPWSPENGSSHSIPAQQLYRSSIDLNDHKRGTFRGERLNDIFRLLDLRHQIHEKAVYHRVVQSAIAMLSRACLILGDKKPTLKCLYGYEAESPALAGDDHFLEHLIDISLDEETKHKRSRRNKADAHRTLVHKLAERRVYRPLMVIPGDRVNILLQLHHDSREKLELVLRQLAAIIDSKFFSKFFLLVSKLIELFLQHAIESEDEIYEQIALLISDDTQLAKASGAGTIPKRVIFWTTPYKQLYKDPAILVRVNEHITVTVDELKDHPDISESLRSRIVAGIGDAETKNEALWKFYVFISDSLFYTGVLAKILPQHPCQNAKNHEEHLQTAKGLIVRAINCAWDYWNSKKRSIDVNNEASYDKLRQFLNTQASNDELRALLDLLQSRRMLDRSKTSYDDTLNVVSVLDRKPSATPSLASSYDDMLNEISGVQVSQYLHTDDDSTRCRDVRYKFDDQADFEAALQQVVNGGDREALRAAYSSLGLAKDLLRMEELVEVLTKLHKNSSRVSQLVEKTAARNKPFDPDVLRSFWNDL